MTDRILVVGAGGSVAGTVVPALAGSGLRIRGLVHASDYRDDVLAQGADEVVVGDLADGATVEEALHGASRCFYLAPAFLEDEAQIGVAFVDAAVRAGVRRIVFSSVIHPSLGLVNHAAKRPVEQAVYDSGLEYTVVQPALFFQNFAGSWSRTVESGVLAEPWSADTRFSRVDYRDVAEVAARALTSDDLLGGTFELASPGHLNRHDLAAIISEISGRKIRAERVDPARTGAPEPLRAMFDHYDRVGILSSPLTLTAILGREPRRIRSFFQELADTATKEHT